MVLSGCHRLRTARYGCPPQIRPKKNLAPWGRTMDRRRALSNGWQQSRPVSAWLAGASGVLREMPTALPVPRTQVECRLKSGSARCRCSAVTHAPMPRPG